MFLFIFENIGTSELILVGIVALIFLGPRKLPEMARKMGKMMADFRATTSEFKSTWEREVNFEEEAKALDISALEAETVSRTNSNAPKSPIEPSVREIDADSFQHLVPGTLTPVESANEEPDPPETNDKKNWL